MWTNEVYENSFGRKYNRFRCDALTTTAHNIFGDLVVDAYVEKEVSQFFDDEYIQNGLDRIDIKDKSVDPDDGFSVTFVLINGKKIDIWTSEWGGIQSV